MDINYQYNVPLEAEDVIRVFRSSGIRRPVGQKERIEMMLNHANLIWTAWDDDTLVGIARALSDFSYCCYLSDLAVDHRYQKAGIGKQLIHRVQETAGEQAALILLSAPEAMDYYPKVGFNTVHNGFIIPRVR